MVLYSRVRPSSGPLPLVTIQPNELFGAAVAELVITVFLLYYPVRIYFSKKVRKFLINAPSSKNSFKRTRVPRAD